MLNKEFSDWLVARSEEVNFATTTNQTETAIKSQAGVELVLRLVAFRNVPYTPGLDVHEYLDKALFKLAAPNATNIANETAIFSRTFALLNAALGDKAFKRWTGPGFQRQVFDVPCMRSLQPVFQ